MPEENQSVRHGSISKQAPPIQVAHLFPIVEARLSELLRSLAPADWERPTICPGWTVKEVAAHLLDTNIRNLSMRRDGYFGEKPAGADSYESLVRFLDRLNAEWVKAARRISPRVLIDWLEMTSREACEFYASLDPLARAPFPVAWAGQAESLNWFDLAREYTERWHHQQQIRLAVAMSGSPMFTEIMTRELYHPVLDAFMYALPRTYSNVAAAEGAALKIVVTGEAGGTWFLVRSKDRWRLNNPAPASIAAVVSIPQDLAWRLFTKGLDEQERRSTIKMEGDIALAELIANAIGIMG